MRERKREEEREIERERDRQTQRESNIEVEGVILDQMELHEGYGLYVIRS